MRCRRLPEACDTGAGRLRSPRRQQRCCSSLQRRFAGEAELGINHRARPIDKHRHRDAGYAIQLPDGTSVNENPLLEFLLVTKSGERFQRFVPRVHGENDQLLAGMLLDQTTEVRSLRTTGTSAVAEEADHRGLSLEIAQLNAMTVEVAQLEIRGGPALHARE